MRRDLVATTSPVGLLLQIRRKTRLTVKTMSM